MVWCGVCGIRVAVIRAQVAHLPLTASWCATCYGFGAIPLAFAVAHTLAIGGMARADTAWYEVIHKTLPWYRLSCAEFDELIDEQLGLIRA